MNMRDWILFVLPTLKYSNIGTGNLLYLYLGGVEIKNSIFADVFDCIF